MSLLLIKIDHDIFMLLLVFLCGYGCGSIPFGLLLGKYAGLGDIRSAGSGNIGATNVLRLGGKKLGALTLALDMLKGALPVFIAGLFHSDYAVVVGLGAFIGHLFPVWLMFKGGKGVATGIGVLLGLDWVLGLGVIATWLFTAAAFRYSSLAALTAFGFAPLLAMLISHNFQIAVVTLILTFAIWIRHNANLQRLAAGTETKINLGSSQKWSQAESEDNA